MFDLSGKNTVIFGGTAGIGLAVAQRFVQAGARVLIAGRRAGEEIAAGIGASFVAVDVTAEAQVRRALEQAAEGDGRGDGLDVIVNNAGVGVSGRTIAEEPIAELDLRLAVNLKGVYHALKHGPGFMGQGGSIINTASVANFLTLPGYGSYSASKAALVSLTRTAALELAPRGIRVNAVCPGSIKTEMLAQNPREIALVEKLAPLGRIGELADIVGIYHFLAAGESAYITGQAMAVDGGLTAGFGQGLMAALAG